RGVDFERGPCLTNRLTFRLASGSIRAMHKVPGVLLRAALALVLANPLRGAAQTNVTLPPREKLQLYLLMGQSNMAGRGELGTEDQTPHPRVLSFSLSNLWELAIEPVTRDRPSGLGVGPGLAFGKAMAERNPEATIGLVPCAVGGTPL